MDCDDGLMLNIEEPKNDDFVASSPDNRSKIKWKERRQQRRNNVLFKERQNLNRREQKRENNNDWMRNKNLKLKDEENQKTKQGPKFTSKPQIISSLFRHNPEIPKVKSESKDKEKHCQIDKPLFSGDKFSELPLSPHMVSNLENNLQMTTMTSIQRSAIPALINGKDVFVKSKTGSGKTLCYALPVVHTLQGIKPKIERCDGPYALVLVPTRELALQSLSLLQKLVKPFQWVVPGFVVGGEKRKSEKARLRKGINILVATPGRLLDHIEKTECLELRKIRWIILDEADRLLDMGFEKDVSTILQSVKDKIPRDARCQTVLMSATLNKGVEKLVQMFLSDPQFVDEIGTKDATEKQTNEPKKTVQEDSTPKTPQQLKQFFVIVPSKMRLVALAAVLISKHNGCHPCKSIVFLSSRDSVDFHHTLFRSVLCGTEGISISGKKLKLFKLHGNMSQSERTEVFNEYSSCTGGVLLCTDVAARGLDLPNVNWIIQYNTPGSAVDYIHRVGRTARIGSEGQALIFLTPSEAGYLDTLAEHSIRPTEVLVSDVLQTLLPAEKSKADKRGKKKDLIDHQVQETATSMQLKFEEFILSNAENKKSAKKAYQSFVRSYATFPANLKHIFHVKNLHLGHVAKAFALRDAPTGMFGQGKDKRKKERTRKENLDKRTTKKKRALLVDEHIAEDKFSGPRPKKRKKKQ